MNAGGPGPVFTPFHARRVAASGETVEQDNAKAAAGTMLKHPGSAEEAAVSAGRQTRRLPAHRRRIRTFSG